MRRISKDITKHYQMACSSMSYTLFAFYRLMFAMCLLFLFLRLFCYIRVARQKCRPSSTNYDLSILIPNLIVDEVQDDLLTKCKYNIKDAYSY